MNRKQIVRLIQLILTAVAVLTLTSLAEARNHPSNAIILVQPADLPKLAQQPGEAMLLHKTGDGRTLLYIEQNEGTRLAIFDVTDPANVKGDNSVPLDTPGSFDFVLSLGDSAELVRFRHGKGDALLDLQQVEVPTIKLIEGLKFQGWTERLGDDGFLIADQAGVRSYANAVDYQVVETTNAPEPDRVYDVKQVREEVRNDETGTIFLLAADGLYLVRRPAVEQEYWIHEYQMSNPG